MSYISNKKLRQELIKSKSSGELTNETLDILLKMIDNIQTKFTYLDEDDRDDCRSHAIFVVLTKWEKYNIEHENPFSYFTQMIKNGLYAGWNEISKYRDNNHFSISNIFEDDV